MQKSNAPSDKALMDCVVSNTAWLNKVVATQTIASQKANAAHLAAEKAKAVKHAADLLAADKAAGTAHDKAAAKMATTGKAAHDKGCNGAMRKGCSTAEQAAAAAEARRQIALAKEAAAKAHKPFTGMSSRVR